MTQSDLNKLTSEVAIELLKSLLSSVINTQERVMFLNKLFEKASEKEEKDRTQEDKKLIKEHEVNIKAFKEGLEQSTIHIENFRTLIESYSKNEPVKL